MKLSKILLPSFTNLLLLIVFIAFLLQPLFSADIWWHLKTGELIWNTNTIPRFDVFSFTNFGTEWIAHEWLSEWVFYGCYKVAGLAGLLLWRALMALGVFFLLDRIMRLRKVEPLYRIAGILLAIAGTGILWLVRPHLWTVLFTMLLIWILEKKNTTPGHKSLWIIPLLFIPWVNLHTGYVVGLVVLGIYVINNVMGFVRAGSKPAPTFKSVIVNQHITILALSLLACLLNPNGYHIFLFPFAFATGALPNYKYVTEWATPAFKQVPVFFIMIISLILMLIRKFRIQSPPLGGFRGPHSALSDTLLTAFFLALAFSAVRHAPFFVIAVMPVFCVLLQSTVGAGVRAGSKPAPATIKHIASSLAAIEQQMSGHITVWILIAAGVLFTLVGNLPVQIEEKNFPVEAVQYIKEHNIRGRYFHHYNWGGYLIWHLWPQNKVFIDGRNEVHGMRFLEDEYLALLNAKTNWKAVLNKYQISHILLPPGEPLAKLLKENPEWQVLYQDEKAFLFHHYIHWNN
ncbi:hypothetical protein ACFL57_01730 [Candidatus Margulisiibacteriota bacterium]